MVIFCKKVVTSLSANGDMISRYHSRKSQLIIFYEDSIIETAVTLHENNVSCNFIGVLRRAFTETNIRYRCWVPYIKIS